MDQGGDVRLSREEIRKQRELEEARKAGTAPAARDEDGNEINPHIPTYISKVPFFYKTGSNTLKHQRVLNEKKFDDKETITKLHPKGLKKVKFKKGACDNCGSMTHKARDCCERPRAKKAKYTHENLASDEFIVPKRNLSFDAKRDRWHNYNPESHKYVVQQHEEVEAERHRIKTEEFDKMSDSAVSAEEKAKIAEKVAEDSAIAEANTTNAFATTFDRETKSTVRNLRQREDIPKYLRNLNVDSAYYDPKTRSMRENPNPEKNPEDLDFAGDNFVRYTGDVVGFNDQLLYALKGYEMGQNIHMEAVPTQAHVLQKKYEDGLNEFNNVAQKMLSEKYGNAADNDKVDKDLLLGQTETYVEYNANGEVINKDNDKKKVVLSKYEEDVHPGNHTSIFGSYYKDGKWGFACCHQFQKNAWCTGNAGKDAAAAGPSAPIPMKTPVEATSKA